MIADQIENLIVKYLNAEASASEMDALEAWLEENENDKLFIDYVKVNYLVDINTKQFDSKHLLEELSALVQEEKQKTIRMRAQKLMRYAAVFVLFIFSSYWVTTYVLTPQASEQTLNEVVLKSENGLVNVLNSKGESQIKNREGDVLFEKKDNKLTYNSAKNIDKLVYNTLTVPYGRQFSITLSDGTHVDLNAGTSIRFPVKFIEGQNRKVFIEYGEAFFDVAKDAKHPFIVNNNTMDIRVLGTQFNVSAYPEDEHVSTVLVEGAVQLTEQSQEGKTLLKPGYKAIWTESYKNFEVSEADIELHTGWRSGKIVLKSLPFTQMVKKLERHYNVKIESKDQNLNNEVITATFDEENIEQVLQLINEIHPIDYDVDGRQVNIRPLTDN
jgi:ferric-dicitrate binding protein FerR (iron transport regulator)